MDYTFLKKTFTENTFFDNKSWLYSPHALPLSPDTIETLKEIGDASLSFYHAINNLYYKSKTNTSILRNKDLKLPWVCEYLDKGKPDFFLKHVSIKHLQKTSPVVIRPDLLITQDGFALTELDSVPGGIGLTSFLSHFYSKFDEDCFGSNMLNSFAQTLESLLPNKDNPIIFFAICEEAKDYLPEFKWITNELQNQGKNYFCGNPNDLIEKNGKLYSKDSSEPIDIIYRFFELFDHKSIHTLPQILKAVEDKSVILTPPMKPHQEEKLSLALFHHYMLQDYWEEALSKKHLILLRKIIPKTWIIDPTPVPPNAYLNAPLVNNNNINNWEELTNTSQKQRNWILKISGFNEMAWGARSVVLGTDISKEDWTKSIQNAINPNNEAYYILQNYHNPKRLEHNIYDEKGALTVKETRVRLCPYYFIKGGKAQLSGILATLCPSDKKIIHGMKDAALIPCTIIKDERRTS